MRWTTRWRSACGGSGGSLVKVNQVGRLKKTVVPNYDWPVSICAKVRRKGRRDVGRRDVEL